MSLLRANAQGELLQVLRTEEQVARYPTAPEGTAHELAIDAEANAELLDLIATELDHFRLVEGQLTYKRSGVVIQPPDEKTQRLDQLRTDNGDALDLATFEGSQTLVQTLARKIAWLEAEIRNLNNR